MTATADVNVEFYESSPLNADEISLARAGELTKWECNIFCVLTNNHILSA